MPQQDGVEGIEIAPGVVFSDKLWSRLGDKTRDMERHKQRERMGNTDAVPNVPTAVFDHVFRNDNTWKQRWERLDIGSARLRALYRVPLLPCALNPAHSSYRS